MRLLRLLFPLLISGSPVWLLAQNQYATALLPDSLRCQASSVLRFSETVFTVKNLEEATAEQTYAVTILGPTGQKYAQAVEHEDRFQGIKLLEAKLFDSRGQLVRASKKDDIKEYGNNAEYEFSDDRVRVLEMSYPLFPYTVEFKIRRTYTHGFMWILAFEVERLGQSVERSSYALVLPKAYQIRWKGIHTALQPKKTDGETVTWRWTAQHLIARSDEPFNDYPDGVYASIQFAPQQIKMDGHNGDFSSWTSVGHFFYDLNKDRDALSPHMQATVQQLTSGKTITEKIATLYRYLQQNHRYVSIQLGIGGWQTFDAAFVEQKRYGDCKALSNYMLALLRAANIPAYHVIVKAGDEGASPFYPDLPTPIANHMILYVPGADCWLECTSPHHPAGYLGTFTADRDVLLLTPEGGKVVKTPPLQTATNSEVHRLEVRYEEAGNAKVIDHIRLSGSRQERWRYVGAEKKQAEIEQEFVDGMPLDVIKINHLYLNAARDRPELTIDCALEAHGCATRSGKRLFVPLTKTHPFKNPLPVNTKRSLDLVIREGYTWQDTIVLHLPTNFVVENAPTGKKLYSEFGHYDLQVIKGDSMVTVVRYLEMPPIHVPAVRYEEVRQFYQEIAKADGAQLVLVKKE